EKKDGLLKDQALLYKGISAETISEIYDVLYEQSIGNQQPAHLQAMSEINHLEMNGEVCNVQGNHTVTKESFDFESEV
ncbi:SidA/IucD/PvdA family monooxygenase, partial [Micrococcus sp. SIMBA_144]